MQGRRRQRARARGPKWLRKPVFAVELGQERQAIDQIVLFPAVAPADDAAALRAGRERSPGASDPTGRRVDDAAGVPAICDRRRVLAFDLSSSGPRPPCHCLGGDTRRAVGLLVGAGADGLRTPSGRGGGLCSSRAAPCSAATARLVA